MKATAFIIDTSILVKSEIFDRAYSLMPKERQKKIDNFKFEEGKLLSLGAGLMLRQACLDTGLNAMEPIEVSSTGKPGFVNHEDLNFSISHSGKYAMCMIAKCNIGCDIQIMGKPLFNISSRYFSEEENLQLEKCTNLHEKGELFFKIWTLKESFVKALGNGIDDNFGKFTVSCNPAISLKQDFNNNNYTLGILDFDKEYCASYCLEASKPVAVEKKFYLTESSIL